jgi:hypothetical protein
VNFPKLLKEISKDKKYAAKKSTLGRKFDKDKHLKAELLVVVNL